MPRSHGTFCLSGRQQRLPISREGNPASVAFASFEYHANAASKPDTSDYAACHRAAPLFRGGSVHQSSC